MDERVELLIETLPEETLANLMTARGVQNDGTIVPDDPDNTYYPQYYTDLDVPVFNWGTNALHSLNQVSCVDDDSGVKRCPTNFPSGPSMAASFDTESVKLAARFIARELRALYQVNATHGLDIWGPVINLSRDPRWGRIGEGGTEDSYWMGEVRSCKDKEIKNILNLTRRFRVTWLARRLESLGRTASRTRAT